MDSKTYHELIQYKDYFSRLQYCQLDGTVCNITFGIDRYLNQKLYASTQWHNLRNFIITRDYGCDLGIIDCPITNKILIHHLNPLTIKDLETMSYKIFDPDNLICVSHNTHNIIHYGIKSTQTKENTQINRKQGDTCPWK